MGRPSREYLLLDPKDPTRIVGETTGQEIQKELHMTSIKFHSWISRGIPYKGCTLVEKYPDEDRYTDRLDQLIHINRKGKRYYVTPDCRIYVIYRNGKSKDLRIYKKKRNGNQWFCKIGDLGEVSITRILAKVYLGMQESEQCILEGPLKLENIRVLSVHDMSVLTGRTKRRRARPVGQYENGSLIRKWDSARDAAKDLFVSRQTVSDYCNFKVKKPMYDLRWLEGRRNEHNT